MVSRSVWLLLLVAVGASAADGDAPLPGVESVAPGEIPPIDVEANVRKMLEASRSRQPGPASSLPASRIVPPSAAPAVPGKAPPKRAISPAREPEDYVPLPEGTITVRSLGDVETVDRELKDARKRSGPAPAGNAPPAQQQ